MEDCERQNSEQPFERKVDMRSLLGRKNIVCGINLILSFILIKILFFRNKHGDHEVNVYGMKQVSLDFKH